MNHVTLRKWSHLRWRIAVLLCIVTTINYIDRQALSVTAPVLMEEFQLTNTQYAWITSGFLFAYALGQLLSGPIIDRLGAKRAFSFAVSFWSLAGMAHALGKGFASFFFYRFILGLAEAANFPAGLKVIAEWFPARDRAMAVGVMTVGAGLGAILAPPLIGFLTYAYGWRWAFIVSGAIGFIWLFLWCWIYEKPEDHKRINWQEKQWILSGRVLYGPEDKRASIGELLQQKLIWVLMLSRFVADGSFYFFIFWLPAYLASERGFNILEIGLIAWIPFLAADIGSLAGGWTSSRLMQRGASLDYARKRVIWIGAVLVPFAIPAIFVNSSYAALGLIGVAMFAIQFKSASLFALPADIYAAKEVGTVWGLFGAAGSFGGMLFAPFVGWMVDHWSYTPVFICAGGMHILSALLISLFIPEIKPLKGEH